ncbi:MAG: FHA domain-containing protein, partial [Verrucomicrobia bacterium]|nr:FHA domain-containing protein [Verrucomicrobiota bacterium]
MSLHFKSPQMTLPPSPSAMPYLAIIDGLPPKYFPLHEGRWIAGRSPECDFLLSQLEISRKHAAFTWDGKCCRIEDVDSSRGTWVNGQRLASTWTLAVGDEITIGSVKLSFCAGSPPLIDPQPPAELPPSTPESAPPKIIVQGKPVEHFDITGEMTIGRLQGVEIWLNHPGVSRRHASFKNQPGQGVTVTDLKSTAGSFLNGKRFDTQSLILGDQLQIGPVLLQFDGRGFRRVETATNESLRTQNLVVRSGSTVLLNEINLLLPSSRFIGIIGPSGAGKSTLLNTLSGLRKPDHGVVLVNGEPMDFAHNPGAFGYVPQEDIVHPELTAHQALTFSAGLRLPKGSPRLEVQKLVKKTLDQLGLAPHQSKRIGQLSGGQRKRVSVAVELLAHPRILFLDEPSSGLDPATEFQLIELLRNLADTGCTVICTTHVMENAYLMDQLVVLVGGSLAFQGSAQATRNYF